MNTTEHAGNGDAETDTTINCDTNTSEGRPGDGEAVIRKLLPFAVELAARYHGTTMNQDGTPYILHPLRLMMRASEKGYGYEEQIVGVLHDTIEDTDLTLEYLMAAGFPSQVIEALDCLTKRPDETGDDGYARFVRRCAGDPIAARVKLLDLYDNIDVTRLPELGEWELRRTAKYHRAINFLRGWLGQNPLGAG